MNKNIEQASEQLSKMLEILQGLEIKVEQQPQKLQELKREIEAWKKEKTQLKKMSI